MIPPSLLLPSTPRVRNTAAAAADTVNVVGEVTPAGRDAGIETLPPFSVWTYSIEDGRQLDSRQFRLMPINGNRPQVWDETGLSRDTAVRAWLSRWKHWGSKDVPVLRVTDLIADVHFVPCYKERRYVE